MRSSLRNKAPGTAFERACWRDGADLVAGVDEVGRGAWAGPVSVGIVVVPKGPALRGLRESKLLHEAEREPLFRLIVRWSTAWAVGHASNEECDALGMSAAQQLAARRALGTLGVVPDCVLLDGRWDFLGVGHVRPIVKGDRRSAAIAAASVVAKVTRDRMMRAVAAEFPWYGFEANKGYPAPAHVAGLRWVGPSVLHRTSWRFVERVSPGG